MITREGMQVMFSETMAHCVIQDMLQQNYNNIFSVSVLQESGSFS